MLSNVKGILAKAREAKDEFKASVAPELDRSAHRLAQQLRETAKKSAESVKKYTNRLPSTVSDPSLLLRGQAYMGNCDVDACSGILARYQLQWSHMATETQQCATEATEADVQVQLMLKKAQAQQEALVAFQRQLEHLPSILQTLDSAQRSVATLSINMTQTEAALGRLETVIDRLELQRRQDAETRQFEKHQKARRQELEHLRASVADAQRRREQQQQQADAAKQRERQEAFAAVHQQEIKLYKEKGEIETISRPRGESSASVDEYKCIDESGQYEEFLAESGAAADAATPPADSAAAVHPDTQGGGDRTQSHSGGNTDSSDGQQPVGTKTEEDRSTGDTEEVDAESESPTIVCEVASDADPLQDASLLVTPLTPPLSPTAETEPSDPED